MMQMRWGVGKPMNYKEQRRRAAVFDPIAHRRKAHRDFEVHAQEITEEPDEREVAQPPQRAMHPDLRQLADPRHLRPVTERYMAPPQRAVSQKMRALCQVVESVEKDYRDRAHGHGAPLMPPVPHMGAMPQLHIAAAPVDQPLLPPDAVAANLSPANELPPSMRHPAAQQLTAIHREQSARQLAAAMDACEPARKLREHLIRQLGDAEIFERLYAYVLREEKGEEATDERDAIVSYLSNHRQTELLPLVHTLYYLEEALGGR